MYPNYSEKLKHSRAGLASFIISIISGIIVWGYIMYAVYLEITIPGGIPEDATIITILGLISILGFILFILGALLGIYGIFQKNRRKILSVLGTIFNITSTLILLFLFS